MAGAADGEVAGGVGATLARIDKARGGAGATDIHTAYPDGAHDIVIDLDHQAIPAVVALILVERLCEVSGDLEPAR